MENKDVQEIVRTKRFLKRYRKNLNCTKRLEDKLSLLDDRIKSIKSPSYSGMPRGSVPVTIDELLSDKIDLENRIKRLRAKSKIYKDEILEEIDSLDDSRYCEILESFFIDCISLEDIAEKECYTVRHVYRLYHEAVELLAFK